MTDRTASEDPEISELFYKLKAARYVEELESELPRRAQHRIGRLLHRMLFPPGTEVSTRWLHLVPVLNVGTTDEVESQNAVFTDFLCRLPWMFLTRCDSSESEFLVRNRIDPASVTIDAAPFREPREVFRDFKLPPRPVILLVIPTDEIIEPTCGRDHLAALRTALDPAYSNGGSNNYLIHTRTGNEFFAALDKYAPHIIYFYGHGDATELTSRFLFDHPLQREDWVDVDDIRDAIRNSPSWHQTPPVVWVNVCHGSTSPSNNFLLALSPVSSSVITTRTVAAVEDSRAVAEKAFPKIVIGGQPPHSAVRDVISTSRVSLVAGRWATTVISVQYDLWSALAPEERHIEDLESAGDFPMRVDRAEALGSIERYLSNHLSGSSNRAHAVIWKGPPEQSLDVFARRFCDFIEERYPNWNKCQRRIELQLGACALNDAHFLSCIYLGLTGRRTSPSDLKTDRIQRVLRSIVTQPNTILVLLHGPFTACNAAAVTRYLEFWEGLPKELGLAERGIHVLLAFSFLEDGDSEGILRAADGCLVATLGNVSPRELARHLIAFRRLYDFKEDDVPTLAQELVDETGGQFRSLHLILETHANLFRWSASSEKGI